MAYANMAITDADLIIAVGMRFDDRATAKVSGFAPHARIIHIDIDPAEIGKNVHVEVPIVGDARGVLKNLKKVMPAMEHREWIEQLDRWRQDHPIKVRSSDRLIPQFVIRKLYEVTHGDALIVTGVGQHQMFAGQHFVYDRKNSFISSGGLGTMGFELPAAMGAKVGLPDENVWCIAGDGGFQMTIQELSTVSRDNIGVKIMILNNGVLGMVRQWQDLFYEKRFMATTLHCPDFIKIAGAYNIPALQVQEKAGVVPAIEQAMNTPGPFLLNFVVEHEENVYPMVAPGASLNEIIEEPAKRGGAQ